MNRHLLLTLFVVLFLVLGCGSNNSETTSPSTNVEPTTAVDVIEPTDEPEPTVALEPTNEPEPTEAADAIEADGAETDEMTESEALDTGLEGNAMTIPPLLEYIVNDDGAKVFDLVMQQGTTQFVEGVDSETMGFNGDYLGPTIRVNAGDDVVFNVQNNLDDDTSVHWHGLHVPPEMDGSPHQLIEPGGSWQSYYPILNEASTMWYHPHPHGTSAEQVSFGLAGVYIIDDDNSNGLDIPKTYGVDDIPLVVQDRKIEDGKMNATTRGGLYYGDSVFANGTLDAYLEVPAKQIRLRIVNGSLSRIYTFAFADGREFHQIATDGSLIETPATMTSLLMSTGERAEIVVDVSDGEVAQLMSLENPALSNDNSGEFEILRLVPNVNHELAETNPTPLPEVLNVIERWDESEAAMTRPIVLGGPESADEDPTDLYIVTEHADQENSGPGGIPINGKVMDMSRIDEVIMLGDVEIWEISNDSEAHPIHIHDVQFLILDRNGVAPEPYESGWKDTVLVGRGETVRVIMAFEHYANEEVPFMFHCHILQHEDGGMMGQFIVVDPEASADTGIMKYLMSYSELQSVVPSDFEFNFESDAFYCPIPGTG